MPLPGKCWRHVVLGTKNSWLPGDPRGWRSRKHRRHSSGDYRKPPPPGEHRNLHDHARRISGSPIVIPSDLRAVVGQAFVDRLRRDGHRLLSLSVGGMHLHALVQLPLDLKLSKQIMGECKAVASHAIRATLPGKVWAHDGDFDRVTDPEHQRNVYRYILRHADEGAWVWSFRETGQDFDMS